MDDGYRALLSKRKNRTLAIMLSEKEDVVDDFLPEDISQELRKMILDHVNDFHDFCVDLIESMDQGMVVNQIAAERLDQIYLMLADT
jgi:predicted transcriptional regulator